MRTPFDAYNARADLSSPATRTDRHHAVHLRTKHDEPRDMVHFHGKKLALCCNKTQAGALVDITGTDDFTKWVGHSVTLTPARIDRERQTSTITPAPASAL